MRFGGKSPDLPSTTFGLAEPLAKRYLYAQSHTTVDSLPGTGGNQAYRPTARDTNRDDMRPFNCIAISIHSDHSTHSPTQNKQYNPCLILLHREQGQTQS